MKRQIGRENIHILKNLFQKKFEEEMSKISDTFHHNFSYEEPDFKIALSVNACSN